MDKFVTRTPRSPKEKISQVKFRKKQKQSTIESLARVVVVEKIKHAKTILSIQDQTVPQLLSSLEELESCTPSKEVLLETKIGHVINKLRKHDDKNVQELSRKILKRWKCFYREVKNRQPIEVRCDLKTEQFREKARNLIGQSLGLQATCKMAEIIERSVYLKHERTIGNKYRKLIRTLCLKLKTNVELREKVLTNQITTDDLFKEVT